MRYLTVYHYGYNYSFVGNAIDIPKLELMQISRFMHMNGI